MQKLTYKNSDQMPVLGLGTWKSSPSEVYEAVKEAVKIGYRHIDCAAIYGNEEEIGKALNELMEEGVVKREELWITSKLWNCNHGKDNVIPALKETLADLQLDYLDLYLIHWPIAQKKGVSYASEADEFLSLEEQPVSDTWKGMEQAVKEGLTRNIGVCNFSVNKLKDLIEVAEIRPELNQVELHPYLQQNELVEYCKSQSIHVMAYSPLGSSDRPEVVRRDDDPVLLEDTLITSLANAKGISVAQMILAYGVQRGISVIPKSVNAQRLKQNLDAAKVELTDEEMLNMASLNMDRRYVEGKFFEVPGGPYTSNSIWE
ncbi:MAG: aldo/keto reductase [Bacteroidales bacterium]|jgi:alcohol dehydrogenase (NADP+)|nr:aldo/keto reductase [Bacteroidales bacterium]